MSVLAAIDVGTNSMRLEVVRVEPDGRLVTVSQQKETVRLGEGEFATGYMSDAAIERGVLVCARFADVARGFGVEEIVAVATAAVREAENRQRFIDRVRDEAGVDIRVISGPEEARLIYLGVVTGADLAGRRALFVDIGGGSTELILGDAREYHLLDSLKLGSIRLANQYLADSRGSVSPEVFGRMRQFARGVAAQAVQRFISHGFDCVYASAGTATNLVEVTARRLGDMPTSIRNYTVQVDDVRDTVEMLCKLSLEQRRRVAGLDPERADIVIGGAAVLLTVLEEVGAETFVVSDRGLRHGIVLDRLMRDQEGVATFTEGSVRLRSILDLGRACKFEEDHCRHVAVLALELFEELRRIGCHSYGPPERELLEYAALVHDVGCFLSHSNHQRHAYYLIRNSDLLGFNDTEIAVMANVALYHRKGAPDKQHPNLRVLTKASRRVVGVLAAIMRVVEGLDRSHLGLVRQVRVRRETQPKRLVLTLVSEADCRLEVWWVQANRGLFERTFGAPLELEVVNPNGAAVGDGDAARAACVQ